MSSPVVGCLEVWSLYVQENKFFNTVDLGLAKAFDKARHQRLFRTASLNGKGETGQRDF